MAADRQDPDGGREESGATRPPKVPPVVPPAVPPIVPPVAKPMVPPVARPVPVAVPPVAKPVPVAVPPVAKPVTPPPMVAPPVVAPVVKPVASPPPVVAPVVKPVAPSPPVVAPVIRPVSPAPAAPPVMKPVGPPVMKPMTPVPPPPDAAPPVMKPMGAPTLKPVGGGGGSRARESEGRGGRSSRGGGGHAPTGMAVGPKVMLACLAMGLIPFLTTLLMTRDAGGGDSSQTFDAAGTMLARSLAATLGEGGGGARPTAAPRSGGGSRAVDKLAAEIEKRVRFLRVSGDDLANLVDELGAMRAITAGGDAGKLLDGVIGRLETQIKNAKEADDKQALVDQRNALVHLQEDLGSAGGGGGGEAPVAGGGPPGLGNIGRVQGAFGRLTVRAIWVTNPARDKVLAQSDARAPLPAGFGAEEAGAYDATVSASGGSVAARVFHRRTDLFPGRVFVALDAPSGGGGGGGPGPLPLVMGLVGLLIVPLVGMSVASAHNKPLRDLARELDRLGASGDPTRRIPAHGGEAGAIARSVERMVSNLKFRDQHQMADLQEVASREQGIAAEIHHGLMPKDPPRIPGYEVETLFKPGFEIGGDHFDYFSIDETHLGVLIMDTSVRGIAAAVIMSMARAYVRATAPGVQSPADVLMKVNRLLASDLTGGQYVTALYAVIDTANGTAKVASAGHLPLIVYRHGIGKTAIVNPDGLALGLDVGPVFDRTIADADVPIGVGDRLVLHTDGAVNVQNSEGEEFGDQRLFTTVQQEAPKNSQAFVNFVGAAIDAFHAGTPQNDDITISTVKRLK